MSDLPSVVMGYSTHLLNPLAAAEEALAATCRSVSRTYKISIAGSPGTFKTLTEEALAAKDSEAEEALALSITKHTNE